MIIFAAAPYAVSAAIVNTALIRSASASDSRYPCPSASRPSPINVWVALRDVRWTSPLIALVAPSAMSLEITRLLPPSVPFKVNMPPVSISAKLLVWSDCNVVSVPT